MLSLTNIKKINSLLVGTNTCFKKYLEKSKRLFVRKTYTTSCKLAVAGGGLSQVSNKPAINYIRCVRQSNYVT